MDEAEDIFEREVRYYLERKAKEAGKRGAKVSFFVTRPG